MKRRMIIMGAGGRDFHNFNVVFRHDPEVDVVAFTAAQIPGIDERWYPPALAGPRYPNGIPVRPEYELEELIRRCHVDEVVFAYSDVSHEQVMHAASRVLASGADFRLMGTRSTMLAPRKPVVSVGAVRTGSGKSQTSRAVGRILMSAGLRVALVRHPMPYHDLEAIRIERFATLDDIDASHPTIEEREEYERPVEMGMIVFAGVDYAAVLEAAEAEADVIVWDGGNNDFAFFEPELAIVVIDPLRPGQAAAYHPGETNLRLADVVVVNKVDSATPEQIEQTLREVAELAPGATVVRTASPVELADGPSLRGQPVLVIEDGPTITHGGMAFGAGMVAARNAGAVPIDPRPIAIGSIAETLRSYPHIGRVLPALGYGDEQLRELEATIARADCAAVIAGTPFAIERVIRSPHPIRQVSYELSEVGEPRLTDVLAPLIARARERVVAL